MEPPIAGGRDYRAVFDIGTTVGEDRRFALGALTSGSWRLILASSPDHPLRAELTVNGDLDLAEVGVP